MKRFSEWFTLGLAKTIHADFPGFDLKIVEHSRDLLPDDDITGKNAARMFHCTYWQINSGTYLAWFYRINLTIVIMKYGFIGIDILYGGRWITSDKSDAIQSGPYHGGGVFGIGDKSDAIQSGPYRAIEGGGDVRDLRILY